ncbi:MAG: peptidoglycan DD-metalloendopeptidase family protein [Methylobacillus sp.]|nr:peptidoglycan DD-metalloendopeptidase family protein [Methylobacillus sp.]
MKKHYWIFCTLTLTLAACGTTRAPAPVVDRTPGATQTTAPTAAKSATGKDWRPDTYTVKKGDTLYSLGLEFGQDYKEIAQWNNIAPPYAINVGQVLTLKNPNPAATTATPPAEEEVAVATPLNTEAAPVAQPLGTAQTPPQTTPPQTTAQTAQQTTPPASGAIPLITEPKAIKEPYSEQAMIVEPAPQPAKPTETAKTEPPKTTPTPDNKPAATTDAKPGSTTDKSAATGEGINWSWPVKGKTLAGYNDGGNKGIDIAGTQGQPIYAAAPGKVIYTGTSVRGYGKLIVIRHNETYLSAYAHNNAILVKEGQMVTKGQKIAEMGNSDTDQVKLHFEIRKLGQAVDPAGYLPKDQN